MIEEREQRAACSLPFSNSIVVASEILEARSSETVQYCTVGASKGRTHVRRHHQNYWVCTVRIKQKSEHEA